MRVICAVVAPVIDNVPVVENVVEKHNPKVTSKVSDESVKESVKVPVIAAVEKHNPKVTSKVSDESVKESVKVLVVKKSVKASSVVTDKLPSENQEKIDLVADKRYSVVTDKDIGEPSITPHLLSEDVSVFSKTYSSYQDIGVGIQTALLVMLW
nr:hypothetical protein [Tanacetum cinerariifolium]